MILSVMPPWVLADCLMDNHLHLVLDSLPPRKSAEIENMSIPLTDPEDEPSKLGALALTERLNRAANEREARSIMQADREGILSLSYATHSKACMMGFALSSDDIARAQTPKVELDQKTWRENGMYWFCRQALRDCIVPFGQDVA